MNRTSLRRLLALAAVVLAPIVPLTTSCKDEILPLKGQLMLAITTNLAPPKDFDTIHLRIVEDGSAVPVHEVDYALGGSQAVKLPATLGVVAGSDPNKTVRITVEARRGGTVRTTREAVARVPTDRVALLPLPIDGLCIDTPCPPDASGAAQTCIAGSCQTALVDVDKLPDFHNDDVFGGGTGNGDGVCFDTLACFTNGKTSLVRTSDCSIDRETSSGFGLNVAVVRPAQSDGICGSNACLLPLERDPFTGPIMTGWREAGDRAVLPSVICERALPVLITTSCATKSAPTCGPWSATGSARNLGDASIPFDAAGLPVGDASAPSPLPQSVSFLDGDPRLGFVTGTVTIGRATDERIVTGYKLYWADGPTKKLELIATLPKTGADVTHVLSGPVLPGATHLLAFSTSGAMELTPGVSAGPIDNYAQKTIITAGGIDVDLPIVLADAKASRLLVVGVEKDAARNRPAFVHCKLDGSGCAYTDVTGGAPGFGASHVGATVDTINQKLLILWDTGSNTAPTLYRCNTDGSGCTTTILGVAKTSFAPTCRIPLLVDTVNQKLLAIVSSGGAAATNLLRCGLDGQGCSYQVISANTNVCPTALISPTDQKLLVVQRDASSGKPTVHRCDLDGLNCQLRDISATSAGTVTGSSAAIDTENQKLVVLTYEVNQPLLFYYRCNVDGTNCVSRDLGVVDSTFATVQDPSLVIDTVHHRLFAFAFASASSTGGYLRCNLDGTSCTTVHTWPPATFGGTKLDAMLHGGQLFAVSVSFPTAGIDLVTLSSY
jgi:hypothetical protein